MNQPPKVRSFEERLAGARAEGRKAGIEEAYTIFSEAQRRIVRYGDDPGDVLGQADKELVARYHGKTTTESTTDAANHLAAAAENVGQGGDLGDQIVALMNAERSFLHRPGASASTSSAAGDLGDQIVAFRDKPFLHQSAKRSQQKDA